MHKTRPLRNYDLRHTSYVNTYWKYTEQKEDGANMAQRDLSGAQPRMNLPTQVTQVSLETMVRPKFKLDTCKELPKTTDSVIHY